MTVNKGPQTIAVDCNGNTDVSDIYVPADIGTFTLDAYAQNGDGDRLGTGAWATDAPTLVFSGGGGAASVDASGVVTVNSVGDTTISIDAAGTASYEAATQKTITIHVLVLETTPAASIDYMNEMLTGLTAGSDYTVDSGGETADGSGNIAIDESWMDGAAHGVVLKGDGTTIWDSLPQSLTIPSRPTAPTVSAINATTVGGMGGISGTTTDMEYSNNANGPWRTCTAGDTTNLAQGTYYVRAKAVAGASFASQQAQVTIAAATGKSITGFTLAGAAGTIDEGAGTITVNIPYGTNKANLTPTITHTGASVSPASSTAQDFTNPVTYTVTAADGSTKDYAVTVTVAPYSGGGAVSASINPIAATFALYEESAEHKDISVTLTKGSYSLSKITCDGKMLVEGTDYTVSGNTYTFTKTFLSSLETGTYKIILGMSGGTDPALTLTVTDNTESGGWDNPFTDVKESNWSYDDVRYVHENGIMQGTSATTFEPKTAVSRAMVVTALWRIEGEPATTGGNPFTDLTQDWYEAAVIWAAGNGIVEGYGNGLFGPGNNITREQLTAMLYRYCAYKGSDVSASADLSGYADADGISNWALDAMKWANATGLITGHSATELVPRGTATRAELAAILHRFMENVIG